MPSLVPRDLDAKFANALQAEFLGTLLLQVISSTTGSALGYGLTYAVLVYATKHVSGGHLNPALTLGSAVTMHMDWIKALSYILAQIAGAIVGALLEALLIPGLHVGKNAFRAPGCFYPGHISSWQLLLWEALLTFAFVYIAYAVQVTQPGHGNVSPLAMGLAIWALGEAGGKYTGAALNPARVIASALVFLCTPQKAFWFYLIGEVLGGVLGALIATVHYSGLDTRGNGERPFLDPETGREPLLGAEGGPERVV